MDVDIRRNVELGASGFPGRVHCRGLNDLPTQTIHNDINGENVLYDGEKVCGIIDFGDLLRAPRVIEVATAAAYLRSPEQPLRLIAPMVSAYCAVNPLVSDELDLLFDLVRARLCMTVSILHLATVGARSRRSVPSEIVGVGGECGTVSCIAQQARSGGIRERASVRRTAAEALPANQAIVFGV